MAKFKGSAGFGEASDYDSVAFELDTDEVRPEYIQAVTREVEVKDDDGNTVFEDGIARTTTEVVTPGRYESTEEALVKALKNVLQVEDVEKVGITSLRFTVQYSGEVELEYSDYELDTFGEDNSPDDIDESDIMDSFVDDIREAIKEDIGYGGEFEISDYEAE